MRKRIACVLLALIMAAAVIPALSHVDAVVEVEPVESRYFYDQLNDRAKAIYDLLYSEFSGAEKAKYYSGTKTIDLMNAKYKEKTVISQSDVDEYIKGNRDIFNDFAAAKDALDLDHSELWYIDSGYLTLRVTKDGGDEYHVVVGPGRGKTYLLGGEEIANVAQMDKELNETVEKMVQKALDDMSKMNGGAPKAQSDRYSYLVSNIHNQITENIHYRYEIECHLPENAKFIRTVYGIQTHEGVCEAYARTLQVCLSKLGIECVLVHGLQTKGTPEDHMWNAVNIPDDEGKEHWYVVDATWDDPLTANWDGTRDLEFKDGLDGKETNTYLLVGQSTVGEYWRPSGFVSTGNFEFKYPTIEDASYSGATVFDDGKGLKVRYSTGTMEDNVPAGVFAVTYDGMDAKKAREKGFYFIIKMYDYHPDGTADVMDEWYYVDAMLIASSENEYFGDYGGTLRFSSATCEYVEIAVTTREPEGRTTWEEPPTSGNNALSNNWRVGYFQGDESEIIAQSGMLYNVNSTYEAPPYVLTQYPAPNGNCTAGYNYRFKVTYDDDLYHILPSDENAKSGIAAVDNFQDNYEQAKGQTVQVRYTTRQQDLHTGGEKYVQIAGELPFDENRDGVVDMDKGNFKWIYKYEGDEEHCPNKAEHENGKCSVEAGCAIKGVEFDFRASDLWIDDITEYNFSIEGVVGSRSSKYPNNFSVISMVPGLCPACYRSQGIDWNLWGQPTLLDAPENLDLHAMAQAGGTDDKTLAQLDAEMKRDDLNGRLMLVVEDKSMGAGSREEFEKINGELTGEGGELEGQDVAFSSVFEINFNRLCPMVKLKPNKNQSLRVQVGYPAGVTYESLGAGKYELKAYHFTRCSDDDGYRCKNAGKPGHKWGDDIISVEPITIVPTPYGIVLMCDAFSPFEIVAIEKPEGAAAVAAGEHDVVVVSDMNGKVKIGDKYAIGADGNRKVADGGSLEFTVEENPGYVVDTVSFGGEAVEAVDGKYTLSNVKKSDVLNVTFLPEEVKETEEQTYGATVIAKVCEHKTVIVSKEAEEVSCTKAGKTEEKKCSDCGMIVQKQTVIPATGHQHTEVTKGKEAKEATCTAPGNTAEIKCTDCNTVISNYSVVQAIGHIFRDYEKTGVVTCRGTESEAECEICGEKDTRVDPVGAVDHDFQVDSHTDATCTKNSIDTLKCRWCGEISIKENKDTAKGHSWDDQGYCKVCNEYRCKDGHNIPTPEAVDPTCTEDGFTAEKICLDCGQIIEAKSIQPATGHNYNAENECKNCGKEKGDCTHSNTNKIKLEAVKATCITTGLSEGEKCGNCGEIITPQSVTAKTAHNYDVNHIAWRWSETDGVSATATVQCSEGDHTEIFVATMERNITKAPTCIQEGSGTYTATVTIGSQEYTDNNGGKTLPVPTAGHNFDHVIESTEATCSRHATKTVKCAVCGVVEVVTVTETRLKGHEWVPDHTSSTPATCTSAGTSVEVCAVCGHVQEATVPALGHDYKNGICTRCGAVQQQSSGPFIPSSPEPEEKPEDKPEEKPNGRGELIPYVAFTDVREGAWYEEELKWSVQRGFISGNDTGDFKPYSGMNKGAFLVLLSTLDGVESLGGSRWMDNAIAWAKEKGITDGSNTAGPLTREDMITLLYNYFDCPEPEGTLDGFSDAGEVSPWCVDALRWAVGTGIVRGDGEGHLAPKNNANRAQVAVFFAQFCRYCGIE